MIVEHVYLPDFGGWWRRETLHARDLHLILADLLDLDAFNLCSDVAVVVLRSLDFVEELRSN